MGLGALGALATATALVTGGCGKVASCRPGTLFLNVQLGPYATANRLDVDVSVAGAASQHTSLTLTSGAGAGGVEVQFPNGYPGGSSATVTLTLFSQTTQIAQQISIIKLVGDCSTATIDFGSSDAGSDARADAAGGASGSVGAGGASGGGGGGGASGSSGTAGVSGAAGGGAGGQGGTTGAAGTGGAAGRGGAGGATGVAGRGGAGGAAGMAGAGGRGGAAGMAGAGGGCIPSGPEKCFNNIDDDCDGKIDCADSDCAPSQAQCVALDPTSGKIGVGAGAGLPCPTGYGSPTMIMSGLNPGTCSGCSCQPAQVTCQTTIYGFKDAASCAGGAQGVNLGGWKTTSEGTQCSIMPNWLSLGANDYTYGVAVDPFTANASSCTPVGTPALKPATWFATTQFCNTASIGGGCAAGSVCVPASPQASICELYDGAHACPTGTQESDWNTGYSGTQSCGACSCGSASPSCVNVNMTVGSDYTCSGAATLASGGRNCFPNGVYHPGVSLGGTTAGCPAQSPVSGTLTPTGRVTLCCF
jgi:hypothetical protein